MRIELTQDIVHELLLYDPYIGLLTWRRRERKWFSSDGLWKRWNTLFAGKSALGTTGRYSIVTIFNKHYGAHRVIWLMQTGRWPNSEVDHKNRDRWDNRWCNLCEVTHQENGRNQTLHNTNTTGRVGVGKRRGAYYAQIKVDGRARHLGVFPTLLVAANARREAERQYGFAPGHGRRRLLVQGTIIQ